MTLDQRKPITIKKQKFTYIGETNKKGKAYGKGIAINARGVTVYTGTFENNLLEGVGKYNGFRNSPVSATMHDWAYVAEFRAG